MQLDNIKIVARREYLQRRAQAAGGNAHVVDPLYVAEVEHALGLLEDLLGADFDHLDGGHDEWRPAVELDLARACHDTRLPPTRLGVRRRGEAGSRRRCR